MRDEMKMPSKLTLPVSLLFLTKCGSRNLIRPIVRRRFPSSTPPDVF